MYAKNNLKALLEQMPMDTVQAKKELAKRLDCKRDKVWRLIRNPESNISNEDLSKMLKFFRKYNKDIKQEDIIKITITK